MLEWCLLGDCRTEIKKDIWIENEQNKTLVNDTYYCVNCKKKFSVSGAIREEFYCCDIYNRTIIKE